MKRSVKLYIWAAVLLLLASGFVPGWLKGDGFATASLVIGMLAGWAFFIWAMLVEQREANRGR